MKACPKCGKKFESLKGLKMHLRDKHLGHYVVRFVMPWLTLLAVAVAGVAAFFPFISTPTTAHGKLVFEVYYSPQCGCCGEYVKYLRGSGVEVRVIMTEDVVEVKERLNIPGQMWSCHTSLVEGYFVEGHVPLEAVRKLLEERPAVDGIALPGMPGGSPGMGGFKTEPFTIYSVVNGTKSMFMRL